MQAGRLRHRVAIEQPVETQATTGEPVTAWQPAATVWAAIEPVHGREAVQAGAITAEMDTRIRMRWQPALDAMTAKWRLVHDGVIYNIRSIANVDHRNAEIEVMAHSGLNEG